MDEVTYKLIFFQTKEKKPGSEKSSERKTLRGERVVETNVKHCEDGGDKGRGHVDPVNLLHDDGVEALGHNDALLHLALFQELVKDDPVLVLLPGQLTQLLALEKPLTVLAVFLEGSPC